MHQKIAEARNEFQCYYILTFPSWILMTFFAITFEILLWPYFTMMKTLKMKLKYANPNLENKNENLKKLDKMVAQSTRAHLFEVCLESSFQVSQFMDYLVKLTV